MWPDNQAGTETAEHIAICVGRCSTENTLAREAEVCSVEDIEKLSGYELESLGRIGKPLYVAEGDSHYKVLDWNNALEILIENWRKSDVNRSFFYTSGRSSMEAGFLVQLLARQWGTNNVNNCSYFCHQASGTALTQSIGTSAATIQLEDLDGADLIFLIGANPASNHPRFMKVLLNVRRRGGKVIVINPAREPGLVKFSVPSDFRSLLFGSEIASDFVQPHIGGDIALLKGIAKGLFQMAEGRPEALHKTFIENSTENFADYRRDIDATPWEELETSSGLSREIMQRLARHYADSENTVFTWAMGITHHKHGVQNVQSIVNLALLRGMVGKKNAGLLPLRGHSNVQGIGSIGVTPALKQAVMDNLQSGYQIVLPTKEGMDTLSCVETAWNNKIDLAWNLGGNLYGSNPDSKFAQESLSKIDFILYMNTTLNSGHFKGRGKTTLILPVLARDEEPEPTTQESMFSFIRLSDGGPARYAGPWSEVKVIAEIGRRVLPPGSVPWNELCHTGNIRQMIANIVPGLEKIGDIDKTREEFQVGGRILHRPKFPRPNGKAVFQICRLPATPTGQPEKKNRFRMMTVRSEGQFNTVVYDMDDKYRGV
ncbi:MAG: molybdopterin-dependent oxidoreductase, partial [Nitrospinae bacterium]|nr:molybdopterin-dependent oxidoreductase [Nitrospinota bacterium]